MKKIIILTFVLTGTWSVMQAQNNPVVEKGAPQSNNSLPSGGTLGSNSGVNPMGNPGTIIANTGSSSAINNTLAPHPNAEPGTFLTSSPEGTVTATTVTTNNTTQKTAVVSGSSGTTAATVQETAGVTVKSDASEVPINKASSEPVVKTSIASRPSAEPVAKVKTSRKPVHEPKEKPVTVTDTRKTIPAYTPISGNYVSEQTIARIKAKYGANVYDIRAVKMAADNKTAYIVRIVDDGKFRNELYYDEK